MAKRSSRNPELREKNELSCVMGLFSIFESCHGRQSLKLISNGRPVNKHIIDCPRKLDRLASFDEECRRIQNEAGLRSVVAVDARARNVGNFIQENMPIDNCETKQSIVKRREHVKMDSELDRVVKTQKKARKSSEKAYQSSSCCLNNAASLIHQLPSASSEISLNKLTLAAILEAVSAENCQEEESKLSEYFQSSHLRRKYDQVDEINIQQVQMRAKAFVDQMFIDRKFIRNEETSSEPESFSDALEVLNSNKDLFIKNVYPSQIEKETLKSVLDANFSERESPDASSSANSRSALATQKGYINKNSWQKSDKIVILKPVPRNAKHSENVTCLCSSLQSHNKSCGKVSDAKTASFSFREMRKKLKNTFGVTRKEPIWFLTVGTSDKFSQDRSTLRVGDECICGGVDVRNSFSSSMNAEQKGKLWNKEGLKSNTGSDIASLTDSARKKLDFSNASFSNKQEFDVILEAKRHLSARLRNLNSVEGVTSKRSPKTLERILSSPEHDFLLLSPRRMRFSHYDTSSRVAESSSQIRNGRERACPSPLRSNTEVTSCDVHNKCDSILHMTDAKTCSLIPTTENEAHDTEISTAYDMKSNGESKIVEMDSAPQPELHLSEEVLSEISSTNVTRATQITDTIKSRKDDESSTLDSLSENEANTSTMEYVPSTPSSISHLDMPESIKYQEEHRSPVSVLEPFFTEDVDSPPSITLLSARKQLQPLRLDFDQGRSFESFLQDPSISSNSCMEEEDHLSCYVQLVLQASCLNWDQLSEIRPQPQELLHASLFDEVELTHSVCYYDPKLLFDHINEILLQIYEFHFCYPFWLALEKRKIRSTTRPLAELVLDEIMREADFYLLPTTESRTLDQLVTKDVAKCGSWLDVRLDTKQILIEVCEEFLEESILDVVLEFHT